MISRDTYLKISRLLDDQQRNRSARNKFKRKSSQFDRVWSSLFGGRNQNPPAKPASLGGLELRIQDSNAAQVLVSELSSTAVRAKIVDAFPEASLSQQLLTRNLSTVLTTVTLAQPVQELRTIVNLVDERVKRSNNTEVRRRLRSMASLFSQFRSLEFSFKLGLALNRAVDGRPPLSRDDIDRAWMLNVRSGISIVARTQKNTGEVISRIGSSDVENFIDQFVNVCSNTPDNCRTVQRLISNESVLPEAIETCSGLLSSFRTEILGSNKYLNLVDYVLSTGLVGTESTGAGFAVNIPGISPELAEYGSVANVRIREYLANRRIEKNRLAEDLVRNAVPLPDRNAELAAFDNFSEREVVRMGRSNVIYSLTRRTGDENCDILYRGRIKSEIASAAESREGKVKRGKLMESSATLTTLREQCYNIYIRPIWGEIENCNTPSELRDAVRRIVQNRTGSNGWRGIITNFFTSSIDSQVDAVYSPARDNGPVREMRFLVLERLVGPIEDVFSQVTIP